MDFTYERKINYYETDKMGIVHHSNYIRFLEEARCRWLESVDMPFYVMEENGKIIGTLAVIFDGERTYDKIYDGEWKTTEEPYAAIHRVAVDAECKGQGIAGAMIAEVEKMCREKGVRSMKNDTHRDNQSMQRMQAKNGFEYCGVIYLEDGAERIAFEKIVD